MSSYTAVITAMPVTVAAGDTCNSYTVGLFFSLTSSLKKGNVFFYMKPYVARFLPAEPPCGHYLPCFRALQTSVVIVYNVPGFRVRDFWLHILKTSRGGLIL